MGSATQYIIKVAEPEKIGSKTWGNGAYTTSSGLKSNNYLIGIFEKDSWGFTNKLKWRLWIGTFPSAKLITEKFWNKIEKLLVQKLI